MSRRRGAVGPGGGLFPFTNSAQGQAPAPAIAPAGGVTPIPPPPDPDCHDVLTTVPFSVPFTSTVNVSGGGAALQNAITAAPAGTRLMIQDSLAYTQVVITAKTNLTIDVVAGQTPTITAAAGGVNNCIRIQNGCSGIAIKKLSLIGTGNNNGGAGSQLLMGLILGSSLTGMATFDRLIVEDCTFNEGVATVANGAPGIQLVGSNGTVHQDVWIHRCTFRNNAAGAFTQIAGYGACTITGFSNVYIQNSQVLRDNAVVLRAASSMRGFVVKSINVIAEDLLVDDIGSAGSDEAFKHTNEAIFGTAIGMSSWRNCVAYNCKRWYRITLAGATMRVFHSVGNNDIVGISAGQTLVQQTAGTLEFFDNVMFGAGDGTAFTAAVAVEHHNDVFNFAATGKVLDATDLTVNPLFEDVPTNMWNATEPAVLVGASDGGPMGIRYVAGGEEIIWCGA